MDTVAEPGNLLQYVHFAGTYSLLRITFASSTTPEFIIGTTYRQVFILLCVDAIVGEEFLDKRSRGSLSAG
jgi:hypothetical protein